LLGHLIPRVVQGGHQVNGHSQRSALPLKPVSYRYKKEIDSTQSPAFGLIAEEVAEVNSALVARNSEASPKACITKWSTRCCSTSSSRASQSGAIGSECRTAAKANRSAEAGLQKVSAQLEASNLRRKWSTIPNAAPLQQNSSTT